MPELLHLLDGLSDPCLVTDGEGRVLYANETARELLHLRGRVAGRKLPAVLSDRQALEVVGEAARLARPRSVMIPLTLSSDGTRRYTVCVMPVELPGEGMVLRIALQSLEGAVSGAAARDADEEQSVLQRLGDPLTIIQGYLENLLDGDIRDPVVMRQCLAAMQRQTHQIQRILGALRK